MRYLVVHQYKSDSLLLSVPMKGENKEFTYDTIRRVLENRFPGKGIASPMDNTKSQMLLSVYAAPNPEGLGRIDHNFQYWGVYEKEANK